MNTHPMLEHMYFPPMLYHMNTHPMLEHMYNHHMLLHMNIPPIYNTCTSFLCYNIYTLNLCYNIWTFIVLGNDHVTPLVTKGYYDIIVLGNEFVTSLVTEDYYITIDIVPSLVTIEMMSHSIFEFMTSSGHRRNFQSAWSITLNLIAVPVFLNWNYYNHHTLYK